VSSFKNNCEHGHFDFQEGVHLEETTTMALFSILKTPMMFENFKKYF
jgi:hypothetical protein